MLPLQNECTLPHDARQETGFDDGAQADKPSNETKIKMLSLFFILFLK